MKLSLQLGDESREVRILRKADRLRLSFEDGRSIEARLLSLGEGRFELEMDGRRIHAVGHADGPEKRQLWLNGRSLDYRRLGQRGGSATSGGGGDAELSVSIPAVVVEILVEAGQAVEAGDKLILLESMKMILPVVAPRAGKIKSLCCKVGESVAPGIALVEFEVETG